MDKASIIRFSDTVRDKLFRETQRKAAYYGIFPDTIQDVDEEFEDSIVIGGRVFNKRIKQQREQLVKEMREKSYEQVMDKITYTWFNRFVALKFMEVNGYLPVKVFSSDEPNKQEPDILTKSLEPGFLNMDRDTVLDLKSGGKDEELYKYLTLSLCNYLNDIMPFLFEPIEDYTELLFPGKLLHTDSILGDLNDIIKEDDWKEVEVIGWIYQDYIAPRKEKVFKDMKKNTKISKENIPAATQLFTPHWIVRYLVENSLGRLWMLNRPHSRLFEQMEYYIKPEQTETDFLRINSPEEIRICDPACGSGHMLVYAFDLLHSIYEEEGYALSEIPEKILSHNLFGIEIDKRAGELAAFALIMKARKKQHNFFRNPVQPNICTLQSISFEDDELRSYIAAIGSDLFTTDLQRTLLQFEEADNFGSLIRPATMNVSDIRHMLNEKNLSGNLVHFITHKKVLKVLEQADYLNPKYHVVIANPPYMGGKGMNARLKTFLKDNYADVKSDLFSAFIVRNTELALPKGQLGFMSPFVWMFISSYEKLRQFLINQKTITSLIQLEYSGFDGATVPICTFTIENAYRPDSKGGYVKLSDFRGAAKQSPKTLEAIKNSDCGWFYRASAADFKMIPGSPIAYWASKELRSNFEKGIHLGEFAEVKRGMTTSDNNRFLRFWPEISVNKSYKFAKNENEALESKAKWFPYSKGGGYKKWFGFLEFYINWEDSGRNVIDFAKTINKSYTRTIVNISYYFLPSVGFSYITSGPFSMRWLPEGCIYDSGGPGVFSSIEKRRFILGLMNSSPAIQCLKLLNPTINLQIADIVRLPIPDYSDLSCNSFFDTGINSLISLAKNDWDSYETSWDFTTLPLLQSKYHQPTLQATYIKLHTHWQEMTLEMQRLEEENNRIFIEAYGQQDELSPEVPLSEITLTCNPHYRYNGDRSEEELETLLLTDTIKEFISYSVGCMFGRYSIDKEGLILANQGETIDDFKEKVPDASFMPDDDNIIPILEDEYFSDDIVSRFREFLKVTFGAESLAENLEFIAGALLKSKKGRESSEKTIRDYFLKSFFKDHTKMYKKRPIYWLFTSGNGRGFNALVYMHRYDKETLAKMRTDYLLKLEDKLDARIGILSPESNKDVREMGRLSKLIEELAEYDEVLNNKALEYIDIDLDDGVVVNYAKFEGLVGKV
jgi:type II restriction/modification system DNA methylase subunit YeeA